MIQQTIPLARQLPGITNALDETLHMLRLDGILYCRFELTVPMGVDMPAFDDCMMFHVVTAGHCWLEDKGEEHRILQQGSLALVLRGNGHVSAAIRRPGLNRCSIFRSRRSAIATN